MAVQPARTGKVTVLVAPEQQAGVAGAAVTHDQGDVVAVEVGRAAWEGRLGERRAVKAHRTVEGHALGGAVIADVQAIGEPVLVADALARLPARTQRPALPPH